MRWRRDVPESDQYTRSGSLPRLSSGAATPVASPLGIRCLAFGLSHADKVGDDDADRRYTTCEVAACIRTVRTIGHNKDPR